MASNTTRKNARTLYLASTVEKILSKNWIFSKNDSETFLDKDLMLYAKQMGFSDQQIAKLTKSEFYEVREHRKLLNIFQTLQDY